MSTILFFPQPEFGHLNPPLKLARSLKLAGHRVFYMGLPDFEDYIRSQGIDYISVFENRCPKGYLKKRAGNKASMDFDNLSLILWEAGKPGGAASFNLMQEIENELRAVAGKVRPDLLLIDFKLRDLAPVTAERLGIPTAILSVTLIDLAPIGGKDEPAPSRYPELFLCPKAFDFPSPTKKNRYYVEASIEVERKEAHTFPADEPGDGRPLIYCSLGSQPYQYEHSENLFRSLIEAMKDRPGWRLVLAVGTDQTVASYHPLPNNVEVVNWAPQIEMLKRASIMITHGGLGGVKEAIFFAVPMIVYPCRWDQPHNAARIVYHGLGVRGDIHNVSVHHIHSLIDAIEKDPSYKRQIEAMSRTFREIENSGIGIHTVEKIISDYQSRQFATGTGAQSWIQETQR